MIYVSAATDLSITFIKHKVRKRNPEKAEMEELFTKLRKAENEKETKEVDRILKSKVDFVWFKRLTLDIPDDKITNLEKYAISSSSNT